MLNLHQLADAISEVGMSLSVEDFERWMRRESWNVHMSGDPELIDAVLSVEAALSEYRFADMEESLVRMELTRIALPFRARQGTLPSESKVRPCMISESQEIEMDFAPTRKPVQSEGLIGRFEERTLVYRARSGGAS